MKIGGLIKSSMIDYPGKISCVIFTCGCNFICPFCHNASLIRSVADDEDTGFDTGEILAFLQKRQGLLEGVAITGGEPTLQKDLVSFCKSLKKLGYPVKIDTNGSRPDVLKELLKEEVVDYLAMDIKAVPSEYYPEIAKDVNPDDIYKSIEMIMNAGILYEFRTTCARPFVDGDMIRKVSEIIKGARRFALQAFNPDNILNPGYYKNRDDFDDVKEIEVFAEIARKYVESCMIR